MVRIRNEFGMAVPRDGDEMKSSSVQSLVPSVFVDGSNFFYMQNQSLGWFIDPKRMLDYIVSKYNGNLHEAKYYTGVDPHDQKQKSFIKALSFMGYTVMEKVMDEDPEKKRSPYHTTDIVADMFSATEHCNAIVLVSGRDCFTYPMDLLKKQGIQIMVVSTNDHCSNKLRSIAGSNFMDCSSLQEFLEKQEK